MKHTIPIVIVVTLGALVAGGVAAADAGGAGAAQDDLVTVQVQVTTPDGAPIQGAEATIDWEGSGGGQSHTTLSDGTFRTDAPSDREWEITLRHDNYVRNFPAEFDGAQTDEQIEVEMHDSVSPLIEVVDTDGEALTDADVSVQKEGRSHGRDAASGQTNDVGRQRLSDIEAGDYTLTVTKPGYYTHESTVTFDDGGTYDVELEEGTVTLDLLVQDPTPEGPGTLDADVTFTRDDETVSQVRTNDAGERSVALAVNTRFEISAERDGYKRTRKAINTGEERREYVVNMTREPSISIHPDNEQVVVGQNLGVEVRDEYDRPVEGATVYVDGDEAGETDADGEASVEIPDEGDVPVHAEYDGMETGETTVEGVPASQVEDDEIDGGGEDDGALPGPGVVGAVVALLAAVALLGRRA